MQKIKGYKTIISDFWNFANFWNLDIFFNTFILFLQKNPRKFQIFHKTGIYVLEKPLKNVCSKFQVIPFINVLFIPFWMWKIVTFQDIGT